MARFRATIEVEVWKEHTCVGCGCVYRYLLRRKATGLGPTPDVAEAAAHAAAPRVVGRAADLEPCPGCGRYQPDMVGARRLRRHAIILSCGALLLLIAPCAGLGLGIEAEGWPLVLSAGVVAAAGLAHLVVGRWNPNQSPEANRAHAQVLVTAGRLDVVKAGAAPAENLRGGGCTAWWAAGLLLVLSLAALASPVGLRLVAGAPLNPGCQPPVAGPGDTVEVEFPERFHSVEGRWDGRASLEVLDAAAAGLPDGFSLPVSTRSDEWGDSIRVSGGYAREVRPWVSVALPDDPAVGGKALQLRIGLSVRYPVVTNGGPADKGVMPGRPDRPQVQNGPSTPAFVEAEASFNRTLTLATASVSRVGETYRALFLVGLVVGYGSYLAAGIVLAASAALSRRLALPTKVYLPNVG